jgi:endonuclease/exonuclease/phosphatase family metal-dependent hydrolase
LETHSTFFATFVSGFNTILARRSLWEDLCRWCPSSHWIVFGDFNSILSQEDKHNGAHVISYEVSNFRECCINLGIADLNSTGCFFTWSNGHFWSKLDRVMVNPLWSFLPQQAHVHFDTPGVFSDNSPTSVQISQHQPRDYFACGLITLNSWRLLCIVGTI